MTPTSRAVLTSNDVHPERTTQAKRRAICTEGYVRACQRRVHLRELLTIINKEEQQDIALFSKETTKLPVV
jgi:hypothetical protein